MSSEDADMAQLILAAESFFDENCCGFAVTAVLCYEYLITMDREVALFWKRKPTGASILFFANRYLALALSLFTSVFNVLPCRNVVYAAQIMDVCQYVPWALTIACRSALIAADVLVMAVTWHTTSKMDRLTLQVGRWPSFAHTLFRDGAIYFVVMLVLNVLHLTFTVCQLYTDGLFPISYVTIFTEPLTSILISRFLLNLQEVHRDLGHGATDATSHSDTIQQGTVHFARVIGSLGSSLAADSWPSSEPETISLTDAWESKCGTGVEASSAPNVGGYDPRGANGSWTT
ncbi:hypothetical protein ONZ51_g13510 [Trametes cubensis]|uniref:DUF6533 domain-containing protein n=1 Tax=Trametes cubensis TaxID=1111947 RepID=A0AAD7TE15_9APHY|nr:hypothetical protein ONZ51_g13510 [Trametes cubensis]